MLPLPRLQPDCCLVAHSAGELSLLLVLHC